MAQRLTPAEMLMAVEPVNRPAWRLKPYPLELRERRQWVGYRLVLRPDAAPEDKPDKVPVSPHSGKGGSSTNPRTWGTLQQAIEAKRRYTLDGVAFCLSAEDPYTGIDYDHCRDIDTGEIAMDVWREIQRLNSYSEVSVSGDGVHVICRGIKPGALCGEPPCEMYSKARFFTMSGMWIVGTTYAILPAGRVIAEIYERRIAKPAPRNYPVSDVAAREEDWTRGPVVTQPGRNVRMFALGARMRGKGMDAPDIERHLQAANLARCQPPLPESEIHDIAYGIQRYPKGSNRD